MDVQFIQYWGITSPKLIRYQSSEVAVMKAAAAAYGIDLAAIELGLSCQWVENVIAGQF